MGYVASNDIRIFPTSNRSNDTNSGTNWVTEYNLAGIIANLANEDGFVVSSDNELGSWNSSNGDGRKIKFYIKGYYVEVKTDVLYNLLGGQTGNIYATVSITPNSADESFNYLTGNDSDGNCTLVEFIRATNKPPSGYSLLLFIIKELNVIEVPDSSRINFVHLLLDGGVIGTSNKITNKGTIDNSSGTISGGTLTEATYSGTIGTISGGTITNTTLSKVTINGDGGTSSFMGNIGASTLTGTLDANKQQINNAIYRGTIGTLTGGEIKDTAIRGKSSFAGTINDSLLDGTLTVGAGKIITPTGDSSQIIATRIKANNITLTPSTTKDNDSNADNNLAKIFKIDDGEL